MVADGRRTAEGGDQQAVRGPLFSPRVNLHMSVDDKLRGGLLEPGSQGDAMRRSYQTASTVLALAIGAGLGAASPAAAEGGKASPESTHTVVLRRTEIAPGTVTLPDGSRLTFRNATDDMLKLTFRGKGDLSKNIQCATPAGSVPGPALDELINMQGDELTMVVPPGAFPGACTFTAGDYTYDVRPEPSPEDFESPSQGQVFAK